MNYGNSNRLNGNKCHHCKNSIGRHHLRVITSDQHTEQLARKLQAALNKVYENALKKGYALPTGSIMTGALTATIGDKTIQLATLSGSNAEKILNLIGKKVFGPEVEIVSANVPIDTYKTLLGRDLAKQAAEVEKSRVLIPGAIPPGTTIRGGVIHPAYPVGSCAGQKLLNNAIQKALSSGEKITSVHMAEVFWRANGSKTHWVAGDVVASCNTCAYLLPMMLCNF